MDKDFQDLQINAINDCNSLSIKYFPRQIPSSLVLAFDFFSFVQVNGYQFYL
jgi:hypothetical protein